MLFTLEALEAKRGDCLMLHYGTAKNPQLIVIDGGPAGVFAGSLRPRLEELKAERSPDDALPINLLMVSHIDEDHINGVLALVKMLTGLKAKKKERPFEIEEVWHNSFEDLTDDHAAASVAAVAAAAAAPSFNARGNQEAAMVLASVNQGRQLRDELVNLGCGVNTGFKTKLVMVRDQEKSRDMPFDPLTLTVIGPHEDRVRALQEEWAKQVQKLGVAQAAAFADKSVFNLSSIIVLAKMGKKTMLLTGDARGDHVLEGLERAGLLKKGKLHVDLLKCPHHGSDRNVATEFFRAVTADNYVISADGKHGNPDTATLQMLSEARGDDEFTLHLTNLTLPEDEDPKRLVKFFAKEKKAGKNYEVVGRKDKALSISVDLGDESL